VLDDEAARHVQSAFLIPEVRHDEHSGEGGGSASVERLLAAGSGATMEKDRRYCGR